VADGVADHPVALLCGVAAPSFAPVEGQLRVPLRDVAEVVGNGAAYVEVGVVDEAVEQRASCDVAGRDEPGCGVVVRAVGPVAVRP
jgi:hypothetical protein